MITLILGVFHHFCKSARSASRQRKKNMESLHSDGSATYLSIIWVKNYTFCIEIETKTISLNCFTAVCCQKFILHWSPPRFELMLDYTIICPSSNESLLRSCIYFPNQLLITHFNRHSHTFLQSYFDPCFIMCLFISRLLHVFSTFLRHMCRLVGKPTMWFPNRSDTNRAVQAPGCTRQLES